MFRVGKLNFDITNIINHQMLDILLQFREKNADIDLEYNIKYVKDFSNFNNMKYDYFNEYYGVIYIENGIRIFYFYNENIYAVVEEFMNTHYIYLLDDIVKSNVHKYFLISLLNLERPLLKQDCFCLHSSYISYKDQAILFTAPSGFGKSTQADLWMKYKNAEILNGDRNIVGKDKGHWYVYGTPFSGSSEYCVNRTTSLNAMIILEKGPVNQIKRLDIRGFNRVFSQTTVCPWDQDFCNKVMDLVMSACSEVPVYLYSCTKDESAVDFLYETLLKDGVLNG